MRTNSSLRLHDHCRNNFHVTAVALMTLIASLSTFLSLTLASQSFGQSLLNQPECVAFDAVRDRYLVSSLGNGYIVAIDSLGTQSIFYDAGALTFGNHIVGETLFVSVGQYSSHLVGLLLSDGSVVLDTIIEASLQLDGMTSDTSGHLYVVDNFGGRLFRLTFVDRTIDLLPTTGLAQNLQDIEFDATHNRLLVVGAYTTPPLQSVDLNTMAVTTLVTVDEGGCDGIALDPWGGVYISSWRRMGVYKYDSSFTNPPLLIKATPSGQSNLDYNEVDSVLAVPLFNGNDLLLLGYDEHTDSDGDRILNTNDNCRDKVNPGQEDMDIDGAGDPCDNCVSLANSDQTDTDGDSVGNECDNCMTIANLDQTDGDLDALGDVCDDCFDTDQDGFGDPGHPENVCTLDNCPHTGNPTQSDSDSDGLGDACCCLGVRGNVNYVGIVDLSDLSALVSYLTGGGYAVPCPNEANINAAGIVDLSDLSALVNYLTGGGYVLPNCS